MNKNVFGNRLKICELYHPEKHFNPLITMKLGSDGNNFLEDASVKQFIWYTWVFRMCYS